MVMGLSLRSVSHHPNSQPKTKPNTPLNCCYLREREKVVHPPSHVPFIYLFCFFFLMVKHEGYSFHDRNWITTEGKQGKGDNLLIITSR